jgi:hypothetical protein
MNLEQLLLPSKQTKCNTYFIFVSSPHLNASQSNSIKNSVILPNLFPAEKHLAW